MPNRFFAAAIAALTLAACTACSEPEAAATPEVDTRRPVHIQVLEAEDRVEMIRLVGSVEPIEDVTLSAEVAGPIGSVVKDVGDTVAADEPLIIISTTGVGYEADAARGEVAQLEAKLAQLQRDLERTEGLYKDKLASDDAIEAARTGVDAARAQLEAQRARLDLLEWRIDRATVRSPVAGQVVERYVDAGEFVAAGTPLIRVVDTNKVKIKTRVNERDIAKVRVGSHVTVSVDAYPDAPLEAAVTAVANQADERTRTFPIEIVVPNRDAQPLLGGMVARIDIPGDAFSGVVLMQQGDIVERNGRRFAYVYQPDGTVQEREITMGRLFGERAIVTSGLRAGDEIVVRGQFALHDGDAVRIDKHLAGAGE